MNIKLKDIFFSFDTIISIIASLVIFFIYPKNILNNHLIGLYNTGLSAISIVFAVYFGGFAIVISSTDNDFINFLEREGAYSYFVKIFRFALLSLFVALIYSLSMYFISSSLEYNGFNYQYKYFFIVFVFLLFYGLFNALNAALDSIQFALKRIDYMNQINKVRQLNEIVERQENISQTSLLRSLKIPNKYIENSPYSFDYAGFTFVRSGIDNDQEYWWKVTIKDDSKF